jgi:hypothetical protein
MRSIALLALLPALVSAAAAPARASDPATLDEAERALEEVTARLEQLVERANRDPRYRTLEVYRAYRIEDFRDPRRRIEAKDIVAIMGDPAATFAVRKDAYDLLVSERVKSFDPDLSTEQRGGRRPRQQFALRYVVGLVKEDDGTTAKLAHDLLNDWFTRPLHPDLRNYNPRESTRQQKRKAYEAWRDILRK